MKKRKSGKMLVCFALFFSVVLAAYHSGASADGVWETVCRSGDIPITGFFADDVDAAVDGSLYLVDSELRQVVEYRGGAAKMLLSDPAQGVASVCLSPDGNALYVLDNDAGAVTRYALDTGDSIVTALPDGLAAVDMALSPGGDVYVTDYAGGRIVISRADGTSAVLTDTGGAGEMAGPCGIDINTHGKMAVALLDRAQVIYTSPYDERLMATDTSGAPGGAIQQLIWTAIDDDNNVYLVDSGTNRLLVLDANSGAYTALYPAGSGESIRGICTTGNYVYAAIGADDFSTFRIDRCAIGNEIVSFAFEGIDAAANIDSAHGTVDITVPPDADLAALTPVIAAQDGAAIALGSADFTAPVTCTVTSGVFGARSYTITVHQDALPLVGADVLAEGLVTPDSTDTGGADFTGTTEVLTLTDDMAAGTDTVVFAVLAVVYIALLILGIVLIVARRRRRRLFIILTAAWVAVGVALAALSLALTQDIYDAVYMENAAYDTEDFVPYALSDDQNAAIAQHGTPDGFVILYVEGIRQETWFYSDGLVIDYLGGVETGRGTDEALAQSGAAGAGYRPDMFTDGMTPGTALSAADIDSFVMAPVDDALIDGGALYYADGIVLGFADDALCYVETIAVEDEI